MTHEEKRIFLIKKLLFELPQYKDIEIPEQEEEQKRLLRSLMNIRPPRPVSKEFLKVQNTYLREEVEEKGIVDSALLPASLLDERLVLWQGDITTLKIDAIVNAANGALRGCFVPCHSPIFRWSIHKNCSHRLHHQTQYLYEKLLFVHHLYR